MNTSEVPAVAFAALLGVLVAAFAVLYLLATEPAPTHIVTVVEYVTEDDFSASNRLDV